MGQSILKGSVTDSTTLKGVSASIILKSPSGNVVAYTFTDTTGKFMLQVEEPGKFNLYVTALSYQQKSIPLELISAADSLHLRISVTPKINNLTEIIIKGERPIRIKEDTITFNIQAFAQGDEETVEDLLKKIPGLNIEADGTIKVGNQEIEKLMVDGDDLFEKGYKVLSKNMPAYPIEELEIFKHYSNNRLLKGVEESNKVALNLKLSEDYKRIWFGNTELGYGLASENRYEVRANLMNFGKRNKYYFLTNLNNTGYDATGDISSLIRPRHSNEPGSLGDNEQASTLLGLSSSTPGFKADRTNFNNAELLSLNAIFNPTEKLKIKTLGFFNWDENDFFRNSTETFTASGTNFTNTEDFTFREKQRTGFGKLDLTYDLSKTKMLEATTKYNSGATRGTSNLLFNEVSTLQQLQGNNELFDQKLTYTNKIQDKKALLFTGRLIREHTPQNYTINRFFYEQLFDDTEGIDNVAQSANNTMLFAGFEAHLLDRRDRGNLFELKIGNQYRKDELDTRFSLLDGNTLAQRPGGFQNQTSYAVNDLYAKASYRWEIAKFALTGKLELHQFFNSLNYEGFDGGETPFFANPSLGLDWKITAKNKIRTSYSFNTTNAQILDVYDEAVLTGFRSFQSGTGTFNQLNASTLLLNHELGEWTDRFFANTFVFYTKNHDFFSTRSVVKQNYALSEKVLFSDRELFSATTKVDRYFKFLRSNLKVDLGYTTSNYKNIVNNSGEREVKTVNYTYGLELRSGFTDFFNYHAGTKWTSNEVATDAFSNSFTDNLSFLDLSFVFSGKFTIQVAGERYFFGNLETDNIYYFLDIDFDLQLIPNKLSISLDARNLFNTETFRSFSVSDIGTATTSYRLLPRFSILSLKFRF
ncbi:MAG: carboxypeptidase-like regulatory domain-containing protein [Leeuwenhoekiella sp.]